MTQQDIATSFLEFRQELQELLLMSDSDLDFGLYRIMNALRGEVLQWLGRDEAPWDSALARQVRQALLEAQGKDDELHFDDLEPRVYSLLTIFFRRYFQAGDFISQRRYNYNGDSYVVPYAGEEVKLHWANADQWYVKSSDILRHYSFQLTNGRKVRFDVVAAQEAVNNNLLASKSNFALAPEHERMLRFEGDTLRIGLTFLPSEGADQEALNAATEARLRDVLPTEWQMELFRVSDAERARAAKATGKKKTPRTELRRHLERFQAKTNFDFFIHRDLRGFLDRELDFFLKNEVLTLRDINSSNDLRSARRAVALLQATQQAGEDIIRFLASVEDYQKRLWLKLKMVVGNDYVLSLDLVPTDLYEEVCANNAQRKEWVELFAIDQIEADPEPPADTFAAMHSRKHTVGYSEPLTPQFLAENQGLLLDTRHFTTEFTHKLLSNLQTDISSLDSLIQGTLIKSDNFQALRLLRPQWQRQVKCIYIDPPYNTGGDGFVYKDQLQHSSWLAMMADRLALARELLTDDGVIFISIDDNEVARLRLLADAVFGEGNFVAQINCKRTGGRQDSKHFAIVHEYILCYATNPSAFKAGEEVKENEIFPKFDTDKQLYYKTQLLRKWGSNSLRENRPNLYYPIKGPDGSDVYPIIYADDKATGNRAIDGCWRWGANTMEAAIEEGRVEFQKNKYDEWVAYERIYAPKEGESKTKKYNTWIDDVGNGTDALKQMFVTSPFDYPKASELVLRFLKMSLLRKGDATLDFFSGSGTTAHAVIDLNREDGGRRKWLLVEMGEYFDRVTLPRIKKAYYASAWKGGKPENPEARDASRQVLFQVLRLEQYEDSLRNLRLRPREPEAKGGGAAEDGKRVLFERERLLGYLLPSSIEECLPLGWLRHPFNRTLEVQQGEETVERTVDLVETFNRILGLRVDAERWPKQGLCTVEGTDPDGLHVLILWRDVDLINNDELQKFLDQMRISTHRKDHEWDIIYVNGDHTLHNPRIGEQEWKVTLIEERILRDLFPER